MLVRDLLRPRRSELELGSRETVTCLVPDATLTTCPYEAEDARDDLLAFGDKDLVSECGEGDLDIWDANCSGDANSCS